MPTLVLDLDAEKLPDALRLDAPHERVLALVRWRGRPIGQIALDAPGGLVAGTRLREAVVAACGEALLERRLLEFLEWDDADGALPATFPPATVAVCTRDRPDDLDRCLTSLEALADDGQEVIVVDSASATASTRDVVARHPRARYVREELPGLDRARNRALREARHPIVAFVDDDAAVDPGWLRALVRAFRDPRTLCVTGLTMPLELETEAQEWFERTNAFGRGFARVAYDGTTYDPYLVAVIGAGVNMALRRDVLGLVGPFDEALDAGTPSMSGGDHDMFARMLAAGGVIVYEPEALVWHRHRRDWDALRHTLRGYGTGVYAHLTKHLLAGEPRAALVAAGWLRTQLPALARALLRRPGHMPLDLIVAELRGCVAGPGAYRRARRLARP